jgi:hypothetical protein
MKKATDTIGNRTGDLLACSAMPKPTAPPRAPVNTVHDVKFHDVVEVTSVRLCIAWYHRPNRLSNLHEIRYKSTSRKVCRPGEVFLPVIIMLNAANEFKPVVVVGLARLARPRPTALLSPRSEGKSRCCYCSCLAPDDGREDTPETC